jgi:non-canonical purine NTP pyrophosphatase (RdgB/HAM1 family)
MPGVTEQLLDLDDVHVPDTRETGVTFAQNALLKARDAVAHSGLPAIADDSGLAVDVLGGAPGVFSARWSGRHGDDQANLDLLLAQTLGRSRRTPRCTLRLRRGGCVARWPRGGRGGGVARSADDSPAW